MPLQPPDPILAALERVTAGRYQITRELGRGGMGAVFHALDLALDREVAIKVLPPELAAQPVLRERFVREARLAASLSHPNIVHVHAVEEHPDLLGFVMQYVDGESLGERIARSGPYDAQDLARLLQDTAWALGYAHGRGVVHRDVKPDNLIIERGTGRVMIMDFGIARTGKASTLTEVGQSIGTPHYMSPEQAAAEELDGRSDLYALGCVGFFAATGRPPFEGDAAHKLLMQHLTAAPPSIASLREGIPDKLEAVIQRCLSKEPANRFATGEAMADAIGALQLRSREIAPLLRLFHQQTAQSLQAVIIIVVLFNMFWALSQQRDMALRLVIALLFATLVITVMSQTLDRVRFAVRQGFTAADIRAAIASIVAETDLAREQLLSDPTERARIKQRKRIAFFGGFLAGISYPIAFRFGSQWIGDVRQFNIAGTVLLVSGTVLAGITIALWAMRPVRVTLAQRVAGKLWSGRLGDWAFARAEKRYKRQMERVARV